MSCEDNITQWIFGRDTQSRAGELIKEYGGTKVLIHYGSGSAVRSGLIGQVKESLEQAQIAYVELGGVKPNPRLSLQVLGQEYCPKVPAEEMVSTTFWFHLI